MRLIQKLGLVGDLLRYRFAAKRRISGGAPRKILVVRLDRIGDFMLYSPFAAALRRQYPKEEFHLTLLCRPIWSELARGRLEFDAFAELDPDRFLAEAGYRRDRLHKIAEAGYDLVLQPRYYRELLVEDLVTLAAAAPESIAFSATSLHIRKRLLRPWNRIYTKLIPAKPCLGSHELTRNCIFREALPPFEGECNPWRTPPPPVEPFPKPRSYAVLLPGSGKKEKIGWPPERFGRLADLVAKQGLEVVACGTGDEHPLAEAVAGHSSAAIADLTGKQTIAEFAALVANAALVIGNDTGGIHIAAMSGVPSLAICGGGQPGIFLPYPPEEAARIPGIRSPRIVMLPVDCAGCDWICRHRGTPREYRCLGEITPEAAAAELEKLLEETGIAKGSRI